MVSKTFIGLSYEGWINDMGWAGFNGFYLQVYESKNIAMDKTHLKPVGIKITIEELKDDTKN